MKLTKKKNEKEKLKSIWRTGIGPNGQWKRQWILLCARRGTSIWCCEANRDGLRYTNVIFNCWSVQKNQNVNGAKTNTRDKPKKWSKQAAWNTRKRGSFIVGFVSNWLEDRVKIFPDKIRPSEVRQWILDYFEHSIENFSLVLTCAFKRYTLILRVSPTSLIYEWLPQY